ncbi:hypothetical protein H7X46_19520 [Pseudonocardia sp. C8]|uniref:hypothetical protein n=1 Tax=Pseudonocardia sp. C8 TaxID=2762759 RepID=UPI00164338BF|nr:hypothetical protein [Pseudonocardia sp. C8]MBC3193252.1 hypothetical protein [Pseudonocardia sp. C8]
MRVPDTGDRAPHHSGPRSPADGPDLPSYPAPPTPAGPAGQAGPTGRRRLREGALPDERGAGETPAHVTPAGPWPTVQPPSTRAVLVTRAAAVVAVVWFCVVYTIATDVLSRAEYLLTGVVAGGLLCLAGAMLLWLYAPRTPARVAPARGPEMGLARDRAAARTLLRSGGTPDAEQRRLIAIEVLADAKLPLVTGATFGFLGPLVVAVAHNSGGVGWLGPVTAGLILLVLAGLGWRTGSAWALHRAADRRHTVPRYADSGSPWRPWP